MGLRLLSVELEGFLSYRERQVVDFSDSDLWAIIGENGAGKTAILNAVTFALFGYACGQKRGYDQLIHDSSDKADVTVTISVDGQRYRISRKLMRRKRTIDSEGLVELFDGTTWTALAGTRKITEMEDWIERRLSIRLESLTSSAMLLQGQQAAFFEAKPAEQRQMLMHLARLSFYPVLGDYTRKRANEAEVRMRHLTSQIEKFPPVAPEALEAARQRAEEADEAMRAAGDRNVQAMESLRAAKEKERLGLAVEKGREEVAQAKTLAERLEELYEALQIAESAARQKLPVSSYIRMKAALEQTIQEESRAEERLRELREQYEAARMVGREKKGAWEEKRADVGACEQGFALSRTQEERAQAVLREAEERARLEAEAEGLRAQIRSLAEVLGPWKHYGEVVARRTAIAALRRHMDALETALEERNAARMDVSDAELRLGVVEGAAAEHQQAYAALETALKQAADAEAVAREVLAKATADVQSIRTVMEAREQAHGAAECPTCGREMDQHASHELSAELERLKSALEAAEAVQRTREAEVTQKSHERERAQEKEREALRAWERVQQEAQSTRQRVSECQQKEQDRRKIAGRVWSAALQSAFEAGVEFENPNTPDAKERLFQVLLKREGELASAEGIFQDLDRKKAQHDQRLQDLQTAEAKLSVLPPAPCTLEEARVAFEKAKQVRVEAEARLQQIREEAERLRDEAERQERAMQAILTEGEGYSGRVKELKKQREREAERVTTLWEDVVESGWPESRTPSEEDMEILVDLARPVELLRKEHQAADLACRTLDTLNARLTYLEQDLQRVQEAPSVADAQVSAAAAQEALEIAQRTIKEVSAQKKALENQVEMRAHLLKQYEQLDATGALLKELTQPLGRTGLQARLVQRALSDIIESANDVLGRISNNRLQMEMEIGEKDDDFRILIRDAQFPERPREFSFISGGQKFRVAIAMAIGIGQYLAARLGTHRAEFLVIDEGFGSLNPEAIGDVLTELQRISLDVGTVIVISHDPRIQEFFEDRYQVTLRGGAAQVERSYGLLPETVAA